MLSLLQINNTTFCKSLNFNWLFFGAPNRLKCDIADGNRVRMNSSSDT